MALRIRRWIARRPFWEKAYAFGFVMGFTAAVLTERRGHDKSD